MNYYISKRREHHHHAGAKAPNDIYFLCDQLGWKEIVLPSTDKESLNIFHRVIRNFKVILFWLKMNTILKSNDYVLYQHPVRYGSKISEFFIRKIKEKKNTTFICLIHDLDSLRYRNDISGERKTNTKFEDTVLLSAFDIIICHNEQMKAYLISEGFKSEKIVCLKVFDYLCDDFVPQERKLSDGIVIAGNLDEKKSSYIYKIQDHDKKTVLNLYGSNYTGATKENVRYFGSFPPSKLPQLLNGAFGLVWDGYSLETCAGPTGNYLKYNNPHKTSLYIAAGLPILVWKKAAIYNFVRDNKIGIGIDSLADINRILKSLDDKEYQMIVQNTLKIRTRVMSGSYFKETIAAAIAQTSK